MFKNKLVIATLMAWALLFSNSVFSDTVSFQLRTTTPTTGTTTTTTSVQVTSAPAGTENWTAEYSHKIVLIPLDDDLSIPVQVEKPTLTLINKDLGRFRFSENQVSAVTRTVVAGYVQTGTHSLRPTLYVSVGGFTTNQNSVWQWQFDMEKQLQSTLADYQYKHFAVDWDADAANISQVRDLADVIKDFLNARIDAWDVVLVGHSRGGIFVHELSKYLVGQQKIKNLHTILLDPTATSALSDFYPQTKHDASPTVNYGSLYYDNRQLPLTTSDLPIQGYDNYVRGSSNFFFGGTQSHDSFPGEWIAASQPRFGFAQALADIKAKKPTGNTYSIDGNSGFEIVKITRPNGIAFNGSVEIVGGNVQIRGDLTIAGLPGTTVSIDATVGKDGVQIASSTGVATAQVIINKDRVSIASDTLVESFVVSIEDGTITANVSISVIDLNASISAGDLAISLITGLPPVIKFDADIPPFVKRVADAPTNFVPKVFRAFGF